MDNEHERDLLNVMRLLEAAEDAIHELETFPCNNQLLYEDAMSLAAGLRQKIAVLVARDELWREGFWRRYVVVWSETAT